ncbi:hypothetical protein BTVI_63580 [Pitangus sulphuratus]|nr:hypothetical protein BTVI_63580 [Pitangus sulphuratus]
MLLLMQPKTGFLSCECTLPACVQPFIHQHQAALNDFFYQSELMSGMALNQVQHLALGLVELHEVLMGLIQVSHPKDVPYPLGVSTVPHSLVSYANFHSILLSMSLMKILKSTGPKREP